jgi:hypothetical protein
MHDTVIFMEPGGGRESHRAGIQSIRSVLVIMNLCSMVIRMRIGIEPAVEV